MTDDLPKRAAFFRERLLACFRSPATIRSVPSLTAGGKEARAFLIDRVHGARFPKEELSAADIGGAWRDFENDMKIARVRALAKKSSGFANPRAKMLSAAIR